MTAEKSFAYNDNKHSMPRQRDYSTKNYRNPFFRRKNKTKKRRVFSWLLLLVILAIIIYWLFFSQFFIIKNIEVSGNKNIAAAEIINITNEQLPKRRFLLFKQNNIFILNKSQLAEKILAQYILEKIKIKRQFPDKIKIELFEKLSSIVWLTGGAAYYVDLAGTVTGRVTDQQIDQAQVGTIDILRHKIISQNLPLVYDTENRGVVVGQKVGSQKIIDFIVNLITNLPKRINFEIAYYDFNTQSREVAAVTNEGWQAKFGLDSNLDAQLDNLALLLQEKIKNPRELDYIDLRFGERVFYK